MLLTGNFPDNMKLSDITPVFKKKDPLKKEGYRSVRILSAISKIFEGLMHAKVNSRLHTQFFVPIITWL